MSFASLIRWKSARNRYEYVRPFFGVPFAWMLVPRKSFDWNRNLKLMRLEPISYGAENHYTGHDFYGGGPWGG
jgi:hypothetical protein